MANDIVADVQAALDAIDQELREDYTITGVSTIGVADTTVEIEVAINKSFLDYADDTAETKVDEIRGMMNTLAEQPPNFGEIDSAILTKALVERINRECKEGIQGSTSYQVWGAPYKRVLLMLLEGAAPAGDLSPAVSRMVKEAETVLREIAQEEAEAQRLQQEEQQRTELLEAARQEAAEARSELALERELRLRQEKAVVDANTKAAADLLAAEERVAAAKNAPRPRIPWSTARGDAPSAKLYPEVFDPPPGYDWTGEFRNPGKFEPFLMTNGRASAGVERPQKQRRVILRKLGYKEKPSWPKTTTTTVQDPGQDTRPPWDRLKRKEVLAKDYPDKFQPPKGYDWTGQISRVKKGDYWLQSSGFPSLSPSSNDKSIERPILRKLATGEKPSFGLAQATTPANGRKPWPGSDEAVSLSPANEEFAKNYEPPTGYQWSEYRPYKPGDVFLSATGRIEYVGTSYTGEGNLRHILLPTSTLVERRSNSYVIGAVPAMS